MSGYAGDDRAGVEACGEGQVGERDVVQRLKGEGEGEGDGLGQVGLQREFPRGDGCEGWVPIEQLQVARCRICVDDRSIQSQQGRIDENIPGVLF